MLSPRRGLLLVVVLAVFYPGWVFVAALVERPAEAQEKLPPKVEVAKTPLFYGASACSNAGCHGGSPPKKWAVGFPLLCRCDEFTRWETHDKHADAYNMLLRERGQRMEKLLGYKVTKDARCLNCHGVVIKDKEVEKESTIAGFTVTEGVSCVVCHGAYLEWVERHSNILRAPKWRPLTRQQKEDQFGMRDLWDPIKRTKLCASCHIGNAAEGKVITHDMYAAGHPPLPSFEVATFSDQMPQHWQYRREQAQLVLVGSAVSLAESMRLIAAGADACLKASDDDGKVLDLAHFDCASCHHDIVSPSWRQARNPPGRVGRMPMRAWPTELVRLGVRHLAGEEASVRAELAKFDDQIRSLQKAFTSRPLGDTRKIRDESLLLAKWADDLAERLKKSPLDEIAAKRLLRLLPATFAKETLDFDSARQVAWGYEVLFKELRGKDLPDALVELQTYLKLRLPQGRMGEAKISPLEKELGESLKRLNDYRPDRFRVLFGKLQAP